MLDGGRFRVEDPALVKSSPPLIRKTSRTSSLAQKLSSVRYVHLPRFLAKLALKTAVLVVVQFPHQ